MADQRSVMKEYRLLEQKRQAGQLTAQEEARLAQLRDLIGPETGMGASKAGFDVNAAAARLRESLLPAGLRNRPPPEPEAALPPPPPPEPEPTPETPVAQGGLEAVWSEAPFAPLTDSGLSADALFDPGTLGTEAAEPQAAWDAGAEPQATGEAAPYDPNAQPQWDTGAQGWDPNAQPYDTNAAYDPNAQPYDPNAQQQWDAGAQGWDPNAQPYDANAAYDPNAQAYDPNAQQQWDANSAAQWESATQESPDSNLAAPWGEQPAGEAAPEGEGAEPTEGAWGAEGISSEAVEPAAQPWETEGEGEPSFEPPAAPEAAAWDASVLPPEEQPAAEAAPAEFESALTEAAFGEPEPGHEAWGGEALQPEPAVEEASVEVPTDDLLPFDAGAASAVEPTAAPEGWGAVEPSVTADIPFGAEEGFGGDLAGPEAPLAVERLASEDAQGLLAPLAAGQELTSDDDAFAQGFHLESNGSFGKAAPPAAPTWSEPAAPSESEAWESAPSLDLASMGSAGEVPPLDLAPPAPGAGTEELADVDVEELPVVEGIDVVEELPPEPAPPPPLPAPAARVAAPPPASAPVRVSGTHRVVVHTLEGPVKRGVISDVTLGDATLPLAPQPDAPTEAIPSGRIKAIFFMLATGEKAPAPEGKKVRVTFNDGRQIAGFSPDYSDAGAGFFMIPADTRTNTGRIWVYRAAVKSVAVS